METDQIAIHSDWSKTQGGRPGISVRQHCEAVGAVARVLLDRFPGIVPVSGLNANAIVFLAASHDVGKISIDFLQKCPAWLDAEGLRNRAQGEAWSRAYARPHFRISQKSLDAFLREKGAAPDGLSSAVWSVVVGAHHGVIKDVPSSRPVRFGGTERPLEEARQRCLCELWEESGSPSLCRTDKWDARVWLVSGLVTLADWIGSDEAYFPADLPLGADEIQRRAEAAVTEIGLGIPEIRRGLDFGGLFSGRRPYPLQRDAHDFVQPGGVHVIEAPMGMGKTEAALFAAYKLLASGRSSGIYFALPTQATSNRMFLRFADFVKRISPDAAPTALLHGNSWLQDDLKRLAIPESEEGSRDWGWFNGSRRALFAPFGVGTVDQLLLSILPVKFFALRRMALAGKTVILDEVHSYDRYTSDLIAMLCQELPKLGCTVIILSATLTDEVRCRLLHAEPEEALPEERAPYPRLTGVLKGEPMAEMAPATVPGKRVAIRWEGAEQAESAVVEAVKAGELVLWICDTVASAQQTFLRLRARLPEDEAAPYAGLLHSRFPFFARDRLEAYWMARFGGERQQGHGAVLVSTQVVEQSVDLDADLMVSELAPTDILLQRLGRLWRHEISGRPVERPEVILIKEAASLEELRQGDPDAIKEAFGAKSAVYSPYVLLRALEVWSERREMAIPGEIRRVMAGTYSYRDEAESWAVLRDEDEGERLGQDDMALFNTDVWRTTLDDGEPQNLPTRLSERREYTLALVKEWQRADATAIVLEDGFPAQLSGDKNFAALKRLSRCAVRIPETRISVAGYRQTKDVLRGVVDGLLLMGSDGELSPGPGVEALKTPMRWEPELGVVFE